MAHIAVRGSASRTVAPERGTVHLAVTVTADARADALASAQRAHGTVVALAKDAVDAGTATAWTAPGVHAWAFQDWAPVPAGRGAPGQSEPVTRFRAGGDVQVTFAAADGIAELVAALGDVEHVDVQRVEWDLTAETRAALLRELRTEASRDAVARGTDYAEALGLGEPRVLGLYEEGLHPGLGGPGEAPAPRLLAKAMTADAGGGGFELRPRDIEITAAVTAELDAPD
ncbi:SIMPL domain-containing protein [Xylanimonas protaetiae]|uniref:SIMPL domain-containing protein n=1 Tax=Xylanimonas protaetiae TaxID=2509457 RepID=A0A4V0YGA3_9MICO|nr:SIMPL domain-containing protein [Xylanimonas protaetiae]QAY70511.1 SIMPL domain-containing protein [Xylanimonas protaetiae]